MDAIILAAGRGSRLGKLTDVTPKPLTPLSGKPLLVWQLHALNQTQVDTVHIVTGYQAESFANFGAQRLFNPDWANSNMVRSLLCADSILSSKEALVCYGDIVYRHDIIDALIGGNSDITISYDSNWLALWSARFEDPLADAESFKQHNGKLVSIGERALSTSTIQGQYMGLLKFTPKGWIQVKQYLESKSAAEIDKLDMTSLLAQLLASGVEINTVAIQGGWVEVDNPQDITLYEEKINSSAWSHDWRS